MKRKRGAQEDPAVAAAHTAAAAQTAAAAAAAAALAARLAADVGVFPDAPMSLSAALASCQHARGASSLQHAGGALPLSEAEGAAGARGGVGYEASADSERAAAVQGVLAFSKVSESRQAAQCEAPAGARELAFGGTASAAAAAAAAAVGAEAKPVSSWGALARGPVSTTAESQVVAGAAASSSSVAAAEACRPGDPYLDGSAPWPGDMRLALLEELAGGARDAWAAAVRLHVSAVGAAVSARCDALAALQASAARERHVRACAASALLLFTRLVPWPFMHAQPLQVAHGGAPAVASCVGGSPGVAADTLAAVRAVLRASATATNGGDAVTVAAATLALGRGSPGSASIAAKHARSVAYLRCLAPVLGL
jgi:hypothetical protein